MKNKPTTDVLFLVRGHTNVFGDMIFLALDVQKYLGPASVDQNNEVVSIHEPICFTSSAFTL